jgi:hypothetical protein
MGYVIKKGTGGGGGGDATALNQQKQIDQLTDGSGFASVLKDNNDESVFTQRNKSVFVGDRSNGNDYGVFKESAIQSVFKTTTDKSIINLSKISNSGTRAIGLQASTVSDIANDIQNFLISNNVAVISICYGDSAPGLGGSPFTAVIVYNPI